MFDIPLDFTLYHQICLLDRVRNDFYFIIGKLYSLYIALSTYLLAGGRKHEQTNF